MFHIQTKPFYIILGSEKKSQEKLEHIRKCMRVKIEYIKIYWKGKYITKCHKRKKFETVV